MRFYYLILIAQVALGFQPGDVLNGIVDSRSQEVLEGPPAAETPKERIAIIGAGPGGASAAYYLQKFTNQTLYDITIFERNDHIGGRVETIDVHGNKEWKIEVGAGVFIPENRILFHHANKSGLLSDSVIGLSRESANSVFEDIPRWGIFNGEEVTYFEDRRKSDFQNKWNFITRYGLVPPLQMKRIVDKALSSFLNFYSDDHFPFSSLTSIASRFGLIPLANSTGLEYFGDSLFTKEVIQGVTRLNYASDVDDIHALVTAVSLSTQDTLAIKEGNSLIFESMLKESGATVLLNTQVKDVSDFFFGTPTVTYLREGSNETESEVFDKVIIAAPLHQALPGSSLTSFFPEVEYRTLYSTIFTTKHYLEPTVFGLPNDTRVPQVLMTTNDYEHGGENGTGIPRPLFNSITIETYINETEEFVYKVFSSTPLSKVFMAGLLPSKDLESITWFHQKKWFSYPHYSPIDVFHSWTLAPNVWYLNGMEQFISTMETSALAGADVAALISFGRNTTAISVP